MAQAAHPSRRLSIDGCLQGVLEEEEDGDDSSNNNADVDIECYNLHSTLGFIISFNCSVQWKKQMSQPSTHAIGLSHLSPTSAVGEIQERS